ncbi:F-box/FBD/LRR-repeat protein At5g53840 [Linum grandiflorum]
MKRRRIINRAVAGELKDRISNLPDEIIHDILYRLRSPKQPAQLAILSNRWTNLWRSYPVLDFNLREWPIRRKEYLKIFLTAAGKKFSDLQHVAAVRITLNEQSESDLLEKLLGFVSAVTQELRLNSASYRGWIELPRGLFNDDERFRSLKVVKLQDYRFPSGCSVRFGTSLQVLSLKSICFPDENDEGDRLLNRIIEDASYLETLTLSDIYGIRTLQIQDHPNLKVLKASRFSTCGGNFMISATKSLEILHVCYNSEERFQVSLPPNNNVKVVHIAGAEVMKSNEELNKFISKFPRLESLKLIGLPSASEVVKINVDNHKLLRSIWVQDFAYKRCLPKVIKIDAPWLRNFIFDIRELVSGLPKILINKDDSRNEALSKEVSVRCRLSYGIDWYELKQFLAKLHQFRLTLEFISSDDDDGLSCFTDDDEQESNVPVIQHVKLSPMLLRLNDLDTFIINLFRCCHPKVISIPKIIPEELSEKYILRLKNLCKQSNIPDVRVCINN